MQLAFVALGVATLLSSLVMWIVLTWLDWEDHKAGRKWTAPPKRSIYRPTPPPEPGD